MNPPLASPIMLTPMERKNKPQTPSADAERGLSDFLLLVDGSPRPSAIGQAPAETLLEVLDSPELKAKYPLSADKETSIDVYIAQEFSRQAEEIEAEIAEVTAGTVLMGIPVTPDMLPAKEVHFDTDTFEKWRRCNHIWDYGDLEKPWEMQVALDLHQAEPTANNNIARAMLAPKLFPQGFQSPGVAFHEGYQRLSDFTDELNTDEPELGLERMPRHMTQGENALLWLQTHRVGLVLLSAVTNPEALTVAMAAKLVRKLRKGTVTARHIYRLWLLTQHGNKTLTIEEAFELLDAKNGLTLHSDEAIMGYRLALQRMATANNLLLASQMATKLDFSDDLLDLPGTLENTMEAGKRLLGVYEQHMRTRSNVQEALHEVGVDAWNPGSMLGVDNLACMWLQAQVDQNETVLAQLRGFGAGNMLRNYVTKHSAGRQWLFNVGLEWKFQHLPQIAQLLGWASDSEWCMLVELRRYAMEKARESFIDIQDTAHTVWTNSLLDRKD